MYDLNDSHIFAGSLMKTRLQWICSVDVTKNEDADENIVLDTSHGLVKQSQDVSVATFWMSS
jgi:hypothetical protein